MNVKELVHNLKNIKIITGNGFDLRCGLHSRYCDYFYYNYDKFNKIKNCYRSFLEDGAITSSDLNFLSACNIWDVFFYINLSKFRYNNSLNWSDIELLIKSSLDFLDDKTLYVNRIPQIPNSILNWNEIKKLISHNESGNTDESIFIIKILKSKSNKESFFFHSFYQSLLTELEKFEKDFGIFIYEQLVDETYKSFGEIESNNIYHRKAKDTLEELCNLSDIVAIDTFNYSFINLEEIAGKFYNVNGDYTYPIFGIDTPTNPDDPVFCFSKLFRRNTNDLTSDKVQEERPFSNLIIFGHSLNEADYGYLFSVLDNLNLSDSNDNKLIFAYSVYGDKTENEERSSLFIRAYNMLFKYYLEKDVKNPSRLVDKLFNNNKVLLYCIPDVYAFYGKSKFDSQWNDIYQKSKDLFVV